MKSSKLHQLLFFFIKFLLCRNKLLLKVFNGSIVFHSLCVLRLFEGRILLSELL